MEFIGKIVSTKMDKTAVVVVERLVVHPLYQKRTHKTKKFKAHNEIDAKMGDKVRIVSRRPISKDKHFEISEVLKK